MRTSCQQAQDIQSRIIKEIEAAPDFSRKFWSEFEDDIVRKYYGKKDTKVIAKALKRTASSVMRRASTLRVSGKL